MEIYEPAASFTVDPAEEITTATEVQFSLASLNFRNISEDLNSYLFSSLSALF